MKAFICYIVILISLPLSGQILAQKDTIRIDEVVISRRGINNSPGFRKVSVDSVILHNYSTASVSDLLSESSHVFVKSYGPGGIASPMLRGTGAGHTRIIWNGISIGNPMLGQSDLSLVPAGMVDDVSILYGGGSLSITSGGLGGAISLETKPDWSGDDLISVSQTAGSFGKYAGLLKLKTGNTHFQSVTRAFLYSSKNNFRYLNTWIGAVPVWETRQNNSILQKGFLQEIYYRRPGSSGSAKLWYQSASRTLPAPVIIKQTLDDEKQYDESFRALFNLKMPRGRSNYKISTAAIIDRINYSNRTASVDSRNLSGTLVATAEMETPAGRNTRLRFTANEEMSMIRSNNYDEAKMRNLVSLTASADHRAGERTGTEILIRGILSNDRLLFPDLFTGISYRVTKGTENLLKASFSRNSRLPSMNDMYWTPGGNPSLQNEYAYSYELTWEMKNKISSILDINSDLTFYRSHIKNMIKWLPGDFSYWTPENIGHVNTSGLESALNITFSGKTCQARLSAGYTFTRASGRDTQNGSNLQKKGQLAYIPANQFYGRLRYDRKSLYSTISTNFAGRRYITADNTQYLPEYIYTDLIIGNKINWGRTSFDLSFGIENIFNMRYQVIAYYPMPGRSFSVRLNIQALQINH
ncbi:MAG: TonB-dependent receptor plug domain-containing protein [Bacteroidales bacterium]|nr:TonB-dependent receptor plug domain-containing protein [Bacteroidales bacterium]